MTARTAAGGTITVTSKHYPVPFKDAPVFSVQPIGTGDLRIRGIDVFQLTQPNSGAAQYAFPGPGAFPALCGGGTPTSLKQPGCAFAGAASQMATYQGVTLDAGKRTSAVVYLDVKPGTKIDVPNQMVEVRLQAAAPSRLNASLVKTVKVSELERSSSDAVTLAERGTESYGLRFDLPQQWLDAVTPDTAGDFDLLATVKIPAGSGSVTQCPRTGRPSLFMPTGPKVPTTVPCTDNDSFQLNRIHARYLPFSPVIRTVALLTPKDTLSRLNPPEETFGSARMLMPGGERFQISGFAGQIAIDPDAFKPDGSNCPGGNPDEDEAAVRRRVRDCRLKANLAAMKAWTMTAVPLGDNRFLRPNAGPYDILAGVSSYFNTCAGVDCVPSREPGVKGNGGVSRFGVALRQPHIQVDDVAGGRTITAAAHELVHAFGAPHAGLNRGGYVGDQSCGGAANGQTGQAWPPDNSGRLQGVFFDPVSGDREVDQDSVVPFVGGPFFDLMSYCSGARDANAWIGPYQWNRLFQTMIDIERTRALRQAETEEVPSVEAAGFVTGFSLDGGAQITRVVNGQPGTPVEAPDPASPLRVRSFDATGTQLAEVGARLETGSDSGGATFVAPLPEGVAGVQLVLDGQVVDSRVAGGAPALTLLSPEKGGRARQSLLVEWDATDPDGDALHALVDFKATDKGDWRNVYDGPSLGKALLDAQLLEAGKQARVRVRVSDGFTEKSVVSPPIRVDGTPPTAEIIRPADGEQLQAGTKATLVGQAYDDADRRLRGRAITWFAGKRKLGTGEKLEAMLPAGRPELRLVASDRSGRKTSATQRVRVSPEPLRITRLATASAKAKARTATIRIATNVRAALRVGSRRYRVGPKPSHLRVKLPAKPRLGVIELAARLRPIDAGETIKATLTVLRG